MIFTFAHLRVSVLASACFAVCAPSAHAALTDTECFLDWAEGQAPNLLTPARTATQTVDTFHYRSYPSTGTFVGVNIGANTTQVFVFGDQLGSKVLDLGGLSTFVPLAREANCGYPTGTEPGPAAPTGTETGAAGLKRVNDDIVSGSGATTYTWTDSAGKPRTISLKKQLSTNSGNGGYALSMSYMDGTNPVTLSCDDGVDDGCWGYFVGYEHVRNLDNGEWSTIAALNNDTDKPNGRSFAVTASSQSTITSTSTSATHQFTILYPVWGTTAALANADSPTPAAKTAHRKFMVPVTTQWTFENGKDAPRIDVKIDLKDTTPGQLAFGVRGPFGVMHFANNDTAAAINNLQWGDSVSQFYTTNNSSTNLTSATGWNWTNLTAPTRPYNAMTAISGGTTYEMGLFEYKLGTDTGLAYGGWADERGLSGKNLSDYNGAPDGALNPGSWPFYSANWNIVPDGAPSTKTQLAWGSAPMYGSLATIVGMGSNVNGAFASITAVPTSKKLVYRTCLVLGKSALTTAGSATLTKQIANATAEPSCASASPLN